MSTGEEAREKAAPPKAAEPETALVAESPYVKGGTPLNVALAQVRSDLVLPAGAPVDLKLVAETPGKEGEIRPLQVKRDGRWRTLVSNEAIESAAADNQKWNGKDSPVPPIGQILAGDSSNNPMIVSAVQAALRRQHDGDKGRIGDLIVEEAAKNGADKDSARKAVERAYTEQKSMQYDYALQSLAAMATPGAQATERSFDGLKATNPELAGQIDAFAQKLTADKSPFAAAADLKRLNSDLSAVQKTFDAMITRSERNLPDTAIMVQQKALSLVLQYPDTDEREKKIAAIRNEIIHFHGD